MSKLTKDERDKMPAEDFGDPKKRLFPICDQADIDSAAKTHQNADDPAAVRDNLKAIADRKKLKCPESWLKPDTKDKAGMSVAPTTPVTSAAVEPVVTLAKKDKKDDDDDDDDEDDAADEADESDTDDDDG